MGCRWQGRSRGKKSPEWEAGCLGFNVPFGYNINYKATSCVG